MWSLTMVFVFGVGSVDLASVCMLVYVCGYVCLCVAMSVCVCSPHTELARQYVCGIVNMLV